MDGILDGEEGLLVASALGVLHVLEDVLEAVDLVGVGAGVREGFVGVGVGMHVCLNEIITEDGQGIIDYFCLLFITITINAIAAIITIYKIMPYK